MPADAKRLYFISDVHLGLGSKEQERTKEDRLLSFLKAILPSAEKLFIVGDLFDFWFEYRTVVPKGFHRTLSALQDLTDHRIPVEYLAGNHDYWIGDFFAAELGMTLRFDPYEADLQGKRVFLHHGDGLAQNDHGYRMIKPILRNRWSIRAYRWLHPDLGVRLARRSSQTSRVYTSTKDYGEEEEGMLAFARQKIRDGLDIVVMGHRHKPRITPVEHGTYVNLGDWIEFFTYGEMSQGHMSLNTWDGGKG
ncbi:MAG: lpxH [Bacteroidetes bacterium]|jgi:UDP-2,3-diacylglucosamine hydrolase|nr:lpxH [Bacteroidota bacterium]